MPRQHPTLGQQRRPGPSPAGQLSAPNTSTPLPRLCPGRNFKGPLQTWPIESGELGPRWLSAS